MSAPTTEHRHGTTFGYNSKGCRCEQCRKARSDYMRAYRKRIKEAAALLQPADSSFLEFDKPPRTAAQRPAYTCYEPCTQVVDLDIFYSEDPREVATAKAVCSGCPLRKECLQYALDAREDLGVWGGTSSEERRNMLRSPRAAA